MRTRRWIRRFSVFKQLATGGSSAFMSSTTCSRSFSRQQRYVSPIGALPCLPARPRICLSILGPTKSRPMRQLCRITLLAGLFPLVRFLYSNSHTHRLIPAARLHVATQTSNVPASYAAAMRPLSSVVKPAYIVRCFTSSMVRDNLHLLQLALSFRKWKTVPLTMKCNAIKYSLF